MPCVLCLVKTGGNWRIKLYIINYIIFYPWALSQISPPPFVRGRWWLVRVGLWVQDTSGACIPVKEQCRCILMFQLLHVKPHNLSGSSITIIHIYLWLKILYFIIVQSCCEIVLLINMYGLWYWATFVAYGINVHWNADTWAHFFSCIIFDTHSW